VRFQHLYSRVIRWDGESFEAADATRPPDVSHRANVPIGEAIARGAHCILAMLCHCAGELTQKPKGVSFIE